MSGGEQEACGHLQGKDLVQSASGHSSIASKKHDEKHTFFDEASFDCFMGKGESNIYHICLMANRVHL